jgi:hypothetical protein
MLTTSKPVHRWDYDEISGETLNKPEFVISTKE